MEDIELAKMSTSRMRSVADLVSRCSFPRWIDLEAQVEGRCSTEGLGGSRCSVKGTGTQLTVGLNS